MLIYVAIIRTLSEKDNTVNDLICYCFGYSADDILKDYLENGKSTIMEKIQMEKKYGNCQCVTKNPILKPWLKIILKVISLTDYSHLSSHIYLPIF